MPDESDVRLALLQAELASLESGIRSFDQSAFQVKSWCVTATLAVAGFAANGHKTLLPIGAVAVVGFWLVDSQNRQLQRSFLKRSKELRKKLRQDFVTPLQPGKELLSVGLPEVFVDSETRINRRTYVWTYVKALLHEACYAHTLGLYLFLLIALGIEALAL